MKFIEKNKQKNLINNMVTSTPVPLPSDFPTSTFNSQDQSIQLPPHLHFPQIVTPNNRRRNWKEKREKQQKAKRRRDREFSEEGRISKKQKRCRYVPPCQLQNLCLSSPKNPKSSAMALSELLLLLTSLISSPPIGMFPITKIFKFSNLHISW